jgi:competence protein ComEC
MNEGAYKKSTRVISLALIATSLLALAILLSMLLWWQHSELAKTSITFLNVGQGDAILIQQGRYQILVDGGKDGKTLLSQLGRHIPFWDRHVEVVLVTHPDADHVGGLANLPQHYSVGAVLFTGAEGTSDWFTDFRQELEKIVPFSEWKTVTAPKRTF